MDLITCRNLSFRYEGTTAVNDVNFQIQEGNYLCIVGENGSGKSTLLKGLLKLKNPSAGSIITGSGLKPNKIGYLPQQTAAQKDFPASVYEIVLSGRLSSMGILPFYSKKDKELALSNLQKLDAVHLKDRCYRELSGGQQQRVLLARALCSAEKILFLDEPVAGLDPLVTQELYNIIEKLNKEDGLTIVMVSHDIQSALKYATHILHLATAQIFFGTPEEYRKTENITLLGKNINCFPIDERGRDNDN